jgi:chromosome segregation ATPase
MAARKQEIHMSDDERLAIIETTLSNITTTLFDIKQDMKRQFDKVNEDMKHQFNKIDAKFDKVDAKFDKLDAKFDKIDNKFDVLEKKMDDKFNMLINRSWSSFLWLMSMMIGLAGLIAHAQHWI